MHEDVWKKTTVQIKFYFGNLLLGKAYHWLERCLCNALAVVQEINLISHHYHLLHHHHQLDICVTIGCNTSGKKPKNSKNAERMAVIGSFIYTNIILHKSDYTTINTGNVELVFVKQFLHTGD